MTIKRREFLEMALAGAVVGAATPALATGHLGNHVPEPWTPRPTDLEPGSVFRHGVASGDPLHDRAVLWTRITPGHRGTIPVECYVATDPHMRRVVGRHTGVTSSERDFTVKIDAHGLRPGETPGISSPFFTDPNPQVVKGLECLARATNPHTRFVDFEKNGYVVVDIDRTRVRGEWYHLDDVRDPDSAEVLAAAVRVDTDKNHIVQVEDSTGVPVPQCVQQLTGTTDFTEGLSIR
ncbi:MAG TPA: PhoD-like phosphatase N-terminal domain-containing protein [Hyphomicrobiaceae bacterium]|jgi:phosphodiesterase/alkaline phosphatase D-like protein|nr:PhoD-like phosphatase N-terminal domain-containing protein [Hyphomicrobiaceae bacterium]